MNVPEEFQIKTLLNQDTYLVNGELKKWEGQTSAVFSTISREKYEPTILALYPWEKRRP
jgi:glyceraldehyde-3-phosphate dehydrogenase (NADP+)